MNVTEYLLSVAAEECNETGQRCTKAQRFGLEQIQEHAEQNPKRLTNRERIVYEFTDLVATLNLLGIVEIDGAGRIQIDPRMEAEKVVKIRKYMDFARQLGTLSDVTKLGEIDCYTPACGWNGERVSQAEVFQIGRQLRVLCQTCGGCWSMSQEDRRKIFGSQRSGK